MAESLERVEAAEVRSAEPPLSEAPAPPNPPALAAKANDLEAVRAAVVDAAGVSIGLWLSYLFVMFYLASAVGGVTHHNLFLANPVKLPFLNVDLPLIAFFWLGPILFLITHTYVLLHFVLLAGKVGVFDAQLRAQIADPDVRARLRRQLPINIFVQLLAGPREVRQEVLGFLLRLIAWISLVIGPLALLLLFELQFLPYHDERITWWQRITFIIDLTLLWVVWPSIIYGEAIRPAWRRMRWTTASLMTSLTVIAAPLVFVIATFPGEWIETQLPWVPLRDLLVNGPVDDISQKQQSLWSNRLVLPAVEVIDRTKFDSDAKVMATHQMANLRQRHLEDAVLYGADLRRVDFTGAILPRANLSFANLKGAYFDNAQLERANFTGSQLQATSMLQANLAGASLQQAQLEGANLREARLFGANLRLARLDNTNLFGAQLTAASLVLAQLLGSNLNDANLKGAFLYEANLVGAQLFNAHLEGVMFDDSQLQGADFGGAQLQGASLRDVFVWRADIGDNADTAGALVVAVNTDPKTKWNCPNNPRDASDQPCDWADTLDRIKRVFDNEVPDIRRWDNASERDLTFKYRFRERLDATKPYEDDETKKDWIDLQDMSPTLDNYEKSLAYLWQEIGCATDGAPYVVSQIVELMISNGPALFGLMPGPGGLRPSPFTKGSAYPPQLAASFLAENCRGARGLSDQDIDGLRKLRGSAAPLPNSAATTLP